jgi:hypothetical protein
MSRPSHTPPVPVSVSVSPPVPVPVLPPLDVLVVVSLVVDVVVVEESSVVELVEVVEDVPLVEPELPPDEPPSVSLDPPSSPQASTRVRKDAARMKRPRGTGRELRFISVGLPGSTRHHGESRA